MKSPSVLKILAASTAAALLSACAVGPDYVRPQPPQVDAFVRQDAAVTVNATAQTDPEFWRAFGDPLLERLVDTALANNQDLRVALANYEQANALLRGSRYDRLPTITADAEASDVRDTANQFPLADRDARDHNQYQATIGFTWELDLFGRVRRSVEAQRAETAASAEDLAAMQVVVVSQLSRTYFQLRGWQEQLRITQENADNQARTLQLLEVRLKAGMATPFDVDRGRTQLESTRARIPSLEADIAVATHRIAVLTGRPPQSLVTVLEAPGELPALPQNIAVDAPSDLLRRRPDVAAAERRLAAATARIGVATADLFPRFTLGGLIGTQAFDAGALFERDSEMRLLTLGVDGSFLNVGRVRAHRCVQRGRGWQPGNLRAHRADCAGGDRKRAGAGFPQRTPDRAPGAGGGSRDARREHGEVALRPRLDRRVGVARRRERALAEPRRLRAGPRAQHTGRRLAVPGARRRLASPSPCCP